MNVGMGNFRSSTLLKFLNGGSLEQAASEFLRWCHAGGFESAGLLARRQAERAMFLTGVYQMHV
jgi:lysozyme